MPLLELCVAVHHTQYNGIAPVNIVQLLHQAASIAKYGVAQGSCLKVIVLGSESISGPAGSWGKVP